MMTHTGRLVAVAAIAGVLAGLLAALLGGAGTEAGPATAAAGPAQLPRARGALRTAPAAVRTPTARTTPLPLVYPRISGTRPRVVARVPDPYGGPVWAVRIFRRPNIRFLPGPRRVRSGTVDCAQVGRIVRGRFVWIDPRRRTAIPVPVGTTDNAVCQGEGRAAVVGALRMPVGRPGATLPTVAATVFWGLSRRPGIDVRLRTREGARPLPDVGHGARLVVLRGARALGDATVLADGRAVRRGVDNQPFSEPMRSPSGAPLRTSPVALGGLRVAAVVADPSSDRPQLLTTAGRGRVRCWSLQTSLVAGEPVRVATRLGALLPDAAQCQEPFRVPSGGWVQAGGGAASQGAQPTAERRRMRQLRTMPGSAATVLAFPSDVVEVDVDDPTGVRTMRTVPVGPMRVAVTLAAGDLPMPAFLRGGPGRDRIYTGRTAAGRSLQLRPRDPIMP